MHDDKQAQLPSTPRMVGEIASYHAHIYFESDADRAHALWLRERIGERFLVRVGRWHDRLVGPHGLPMYQVAFEAELLPSLLPWLMLNHGPLSILVHPNTTSPRRDHALDALWIGAPVTLFPDRLDEFQAIPDEAGEPNTEPSLPF